MAEANGRRHGGRFQDLTGKTFGRLLVLSEAGVLRGCVLWECRCECGTITHAVTRDLKSRNTKSCGCQRDDARFGDARAYKHGQYGTPEWDTWQGIRRRCRDPLGANYNRYGARGIVVCQRWYDSAEAFCSDMGYKPSRQHSIDRIDNSHGYTCGRCEECLANNWPANCRWATIKEQSLNRCTTRLLTFEGETLCLADWSRRTGLSRALLTYRLRAGWSVVDILTTPASRQNTWKFMRQKR